MDSINVCFSELTLSTFVGVAGAGSKEDALYLCVRGRLDYIDGSDGNRREDVEYSEAMKKKLKRGQREFRHALILELYIRCTLLKMIKPW